MESVITFIRDTLGNTVVLPIVIAILGIILGLRWTRALRAGIVVGIGFIGLGLVIGLLLGDLGPAANQLTERFGLSLNAIDLGFGPAAAIALGTVVGAGIIPFVFALNVLMLLTRMTKTLNVDIWNYWHYAFSGSVVFFITDKNFWAGVLAAMTHLVYSLLMADATAKRIQKFFNLPGISIPQGWATTSIPVVLGIDWLLDRIPGVRNIDVDTTKLQKRLGFAGEPLVIGAVLGIVIGALAGLGVGGSLGLAMALAATLFLLPRIIAILMEGLVPLTEAAHAFFEKRLKGREAYVGLDSAILIGHPATILVGIILVPITLVLAAVLPGNTTLPFGDLAATAFFVAMAAPLMRGNMFRALVAGTVIVAYVLLLASFFAPIITSFAGDVGYAMPAEAEGSQYITGMSAGNPVAFILYWAGRLGAVTLVGIVFAIALGIAAFVGFRRNKAEKAAARELEAARLRGEPTGVEDGALAGAAGTDVAPGSETAPPAGPGSTTTRDPRDG